jgi:hypothetical protein
MGSDGLESGSTSHKHDTGLGRVVHMGYSCFNDLLSWGVTSCFCRFNELNRIRRAPYVM